MEERYVSFDEVKRRVSMEQLLTHYGLLAGTAKRTGDELVLHCLFHDDKTPSLKINTAKNVFNCFGCHMGGDILAFVVLKEGIDTGESDRDRREAALLLQHWFHLDMKRPTRPRRRAHKPQEKASAPKEAARTLDPTDAGALDPSQPARDEDPALLNPPLTFTFQHLDETHPYLKERDLTPETIATFGLGYHPGRGIMAGRIVIPIFNTQGELVAYAGRWPGNPPEGEPKYKLPPNFHKSLELYNLHRAKPYAADGLIVTEGFFDVMELWQKGRKNVVAIMGSQLSETQERRIVETVGPRGRVLLAFDQDEAGRKGMQEAAARLTTKVFVRTVALSG